MIRLTSTLLALALLTASPVFAQTNVTGDWDVTVVSPQGTNTTPVTFKQEGDKVTGTVVGRNGNEAAVADGAIKNNEVTFKVVRERDGQKFTAKYKGELKGESIKGTVERERDGQTTSRDWEAKRAKEEK